MRPVGILSLICRALLLRYNKGSDILSRIQNKRFEAPKLVKYVAVLFE
jgi:hypothetical protein